MRTIHKHVLAGTECTFTTHVGARVVHVANQYEQITVWVEVDTSAAPELRTLYVVGTGHQIPYGEHLGSALMSNGSFVFHIYG